ncbi:hypothetical protein RJ639_043970 [Escallonia herrerae]|uniref:Nuclear pore complex protein Nup85 n=1 Tax=Escallonia herrerae TaxID=1293975 RepID=A0AA89B6T4_9ASTE|nr:hypothetical protein RJ639_043970 [Escallonia herrerae]
MPALPSHAGDTSLVLLPLEAPDSAAVIPFHHGVKPPISPRLSISWSRGNSLRVSVFKHSPQSDAVTSNSSNETDGGRVVELKLGSAGDGGGGEIDDAAQWRRIAYGSVAPFALLQSRKNSMSALSRMSSSSSYDAQWWAYVLEYSREINSLLGYQRSPPSPAIEDPRTVLKKVEEPTCLKAAWELMEVFYADKQSQAWLPERLVDWLADFDSLFSGTQPTIHSKLLDFQEELVTLQVFIGSIYWFEELFQGPLGQNQRSLGVHTFWDSSLGPSDVGSTSGGEERVDSVDSNLQLVVSVAVMPLDSVPASWKETVVGNQLIILVKRRANGFGKVLGVSMAAFEKSIVDLLLDIKRSSTHSSFSRKGGYKKAVEDDPRYWEAISLALAVGWLDIAVKLLRLHGSYQLNQLGNRETENGLVEAAAVLISKMPRMRSKSAAGNLGECFKSRPDFIKALEKWRAQITKLDCSTFWLQCGHHQTMEGLKSILQIMLGNASTLSASTCHWLELYIAHFIYIRPFTVGLESMYTLAQKCLQVKPVSHPHKLMKLLTGILGGNTEVVLAECSKMIAHAVELLTAGSSQADIVLHEERDNLGGISIEELHRLVYAQFLSSHALTWQIAPIYLTSCIKQGMGMLEILLYKQPVHHNQVLLKNLEICRLYELDRVSSNIMKMAGVHHWKHGKKGSGVFWLQQARDEFRLNRIAQHLFDFQWEGLIELLGSDSRTAGGFEFLHKYRDFKRSLQQVHDGTATDAAQRAAEALILLMKNPSTPHRFWLPLLYDSLKLFNWQECPLLNVPQTNLLLNKLQELSMAKLRPDFIEADLPLQALSSVRLALATNLGRAILDQ